jgi:hypothetical protein
MSRSSSERIEATRIIDGLLKGDPPFDGWHHIDNDNDLLREIIKQLVIRQTKENK